MQRKTLALLLATHLLVGAAGFATGIYLLPILIEKSWDTHLIPADDGFSRHNGQPNFPLRLANPDSQVQPGQRHLDRPITQR